MNFLYIGNFASKVTRTGEDSIARALKKKGHTVFCFHYRQPNADSKLILYNKRLPFIDWVILSKSDKCVDIETIKKILKERKSVSWIFDGLGQIQTVRRWGLLTDILITTASGDVAAYKSLGFRNVVSIQVGCDLDVDRGISGKQKYEIVFLGNDDVGRRKKILQKVAEAFPNKLSVFGEAKAMESLGNVYKGEAYGKAGIEVISNSKIVLSINHYYRPIYEGIWSNRVYKTLAARGFLLQEYVKGMDFKNCRHLVFWRSEEDLIKEISYYLNHEEERKQIAQSGQNCVLGYHTYNNRVEDFLNVIKNFVPLKVSEQRPIKLSMHQPDYMPWLGFFRKVAQSDFFVILDKVQLNNRGYTNRVQIKKEFGADWLTQPIKTLHRRQSIREAIFADPQWASKHLQILKESYYKAPYFLEIYSFLEEGICLISDCNSLCEFNVILLRTLFQKLGIETPFIFQSLIRTTKFKADLTKEICLKLGASIYLSGQGAKAYLQSMADINIEYCNVDFPEYPQLWGSFVPGLSVIDALFNCGVEGTRKMIYGS